MVKLQRLEQRMASAPARLSGLPSTAAARMTGRRLQGRRFRLWSASPECVCCGRLTEYPGGFELDHTVPLWQGGDDSDDNCQILCSGLNGCHARKTAFDLTAGV